MERNKETNSETGSKIHRGPASQRGQSAHSERNTRARTGTGTHNQRRNPTGTAGRGSSGTHHASRGMHRDRKPAGKFSNSSGGDARGEKRAIAAKLPPLDDNVRIIPLGGVEEIFKNMTLI